MYLFSSHFNVVMSQNVRSVNQLFPSIGVTKNKNVPAPVVKISLKLESC